MFYFDGYIFLCSVCFVLNEFPPNLDGGWVLDQNGPCSLWCRFRYGNC